jgi:sugar/nucleoside kinase (ribokinase family)
MYDICCLGHLTLDKVVTTQAVRHLAGGTSFYFSNAVCAMDVKYSLVTALAERDWHIVSDLRTRGIEVTVLPSANTVYFENTYSPNPDHRAQRVLQQADAFAVEQLPDIQAKIYHLGPLLADDIPLELIKTLSARGRISLDVQGYLRKVRNQTVYAVDWPAKRQALPYVDILKANDAEMEVLTGQNDVCQGARILSDWGVKEVIITLGSKGSVIYTDKIFYHIPAYRPTAMVDTTGCGDTYMAGYLYQRIKEAGWQDAGEFAAAMASIKIASSGPFTGSKEDVLNFLAFHKR